MEIELPPLPEPDFHDVDYELWGQNAKADAYNAHTLQAYALAAIEAQAAPPVLPATRSALQQARDALTQCLSFIDSIWPQRKQLLNQTKEAVASIDAVLGGPRPTRPGWVRGLDGMKRIDPSQGAPRPPGHTPVA